MSLRLDKSRAVPFSKMLNMLLSWKTEARKLKSGEITKEEYDQWRYTYPRIEAKRTKLALDARRVRRKKKHGVTTNMCWYQIESRADIENLLAEYYGFHDSCIVAVNYVSGACVDIKGAMHNIDNNCSLIVKFESQMPAFHKHPEKKSLELKFTGLRRLNLIGYQSNYFSDISSCYLAFYKQFIIWSDNYYFDPCAYEDKVLFEEPMSTFIVADKLGWRFV